MNELISKFIAYLWEQLRLHDIYVLGGQGEPVAKILPHIPDMESSSNLRKILERIKTNIYEYPEFSMIDSRAFDCSGLGTEFFLLYRLIASDMTADGLYKLCDDIPVKADGLKLGDMVFQQGYKSVKVKKNDGTTVTEKVPYKHHVGYVAEVVDGKCTKIIEAKGRAYGVVASDFKVSNWSHAGRPKFWNDEPQPVVFVLTRELSLKEPMMRGEDVQKVQERLNELGFNCGTADGVFGKKTEIAVKNFQSDTGLKDDGIVGKKTAKALGFGWSE